MSEQEKRIGKATDTFLGFEDHGILTAFVRFDYGGASQALPPRCLGSREDDENGNFTKMVVAILRAFGVDEWGSIRGKTIFCIIENGLIVGLEPLPTERGTAVNFKAMFNTVPV